MGVLIEMDRQYAFLGVLVLFCAQGLQAFSPSFGPHVSASFNLCVGRKPALKTCRWMSEEPQNDATNEEMSEEDTAESESEENEEEEQLDPEIVALKEEIAELESLLKSRRTTLAYTQDKVEEFSKAGYARKVAEMENMRRVRNVSWA